MAPLFLLLLSTASVSVAIPAFEVDHAPGVLAQRLPEYYASVLEQAHCAVPTPATKLGPQATTGFAECEWQARCASNVGGVLGVELVLLGHIERVDQAYRLRLTVVDVPNHQARSHLEFHYNGVLSGIEASVKGQQSALCKAINPDWSESAAAVDQLATLSFEEAPSVRPATPPEPPAFVPFSDLPPLAETPAPPVVIAPPPPPVVVAAPPPPPVVVAAPPPPPVVVTTPPRSPPPVSPPRVEAPPSFLRARWMPLVPAGVAVVGAGFAIVEGVLALNCPAAQTAVGLYDSRICQASHANAANVGWGVAGVGAVTAGVLWLVLNHWPGLTPESHPVQLGATHNSLQLLGHF